MSESWGSYLLQDGGDGSWQTVEWNPNEFVFGAGGGIVANKGGKGGIVSVIVDEQSFVFRTEAREHVKDPLLALRKVLVVIFSI